jgi:hypothetical protein
VATDSRRKFLRNAGGLVGAAGVARGQSTALPARAEKAFNLRQSAAVAQSKRAAASAATNGDESRYPTLFATYTKGFNHSQLGEVNPAQYRALKHALSTQLHSDFEKIPIGYGRKLVNIESAFTFDLEGGDACAFDLPAPPAFGSQEAAAEMVELYWQAALRDVPFSQYERSSAAQNAAVEISSLHGYRGPRDVEQRVTAAHLFRGTAPGCESGPYLSQYLLKAIYFGSTPREQVYRTGAVGIDYMTDYSEWLGIQSGLPPYRKEAFDPAFRYIRNGRDLAQFVHYDYTYQAFLQAALIILNQCPETVLDYNTYQLNHTNPYRESRIQTGFTTFNSAHVLDWVARVANLALKPACYQKWAVHRRVRPEAFGGCVFNALSGASEYPVHEDLLNSRALHETMPATRGLLSQAYAEGCPLHPAYPAGHAVVAGACATVLKALFEETALVSGVVTPSDDGKSLISAERLVGGHALTLGGEINKLAFNIPMGRSWAGIHYRSDTTAGLGLGEAVAIAFMQDNVETFTESFAGFAFTGFDGRPIVISKS